MAELPPVAEVDRLLQDLLVRMLVAGAERWAHSELTMPQLKVLLLLGEHGSARVSFFVIRSESSGSTKPAVPVLNHGRPPVSPRLTQIDRIASGAPSPHRSIWPWNPAGIDSSMRHKKGSAFRRPPRWTAPRKSIVMMPSA